MKIGEINTVRIIKSDPKGYFVKDVGPTAFWSKRGLEKEYQIGEEMDLFIFTGSKGELFATTRTPKITMGRFEALRVVDNSSIGTFMDWGLNDDLMVPFDEQDMELEVGEKYVVCLYIDEQSKRIRGTTIFYEHLSKVPIEKTPGDEVELLVVEESKLGITVIIDNSYEGLLYSDEVYKVLEPGERISGFIKKIREDGKIDVTLQKFGYRKVEPNADRIMDYLQKNDGFLDMNDKSDPEEIKHRFQMSKKTFKKALGALYKQRLIEMKDKGVFLAK